jgi:hypothetical protein
MQGWIRWNWETAKDCRFLVLTTCAGMQAALVLRHFSRTRLEPLVREESGELEGKAARSPIAPLDWLLTTCLFINIPAFNQ